MTQYDGELSPPFEIVEPADWRAPIIFNSPHSGSVYPHEFLDASRIDLAALRRSEDSFMDELIGGSERTRFSDRPCQFSALLCRRQPRALRARSADVFRPAAELRQYAIDAGGRRPRHHPARGRRRPGDLSRAAFGRRCAGADRGALQALSSRAAAADQQGASGVRHRGGGGLPFDALGRRFARRAAAAGRGDRRPLRHELRGAASRHGRGNHERGWAIRSAATSPMPAVSSPSITAIRPRGLHTIQLELNRAIYMDERRRERSAGFAQVAADFAVLADALAARSARRSRTVPGGGRVGSRSRHSGAEGRSGISDSRYANAHLGFAPRAARNDTPQEKRAA